MSYKQKLHAVHTFVFDVDGVMTDGTVHAIPGHQPYRVFHARDGYAIHRAIQQGYRIAILSGGKSEAVRERFHALGCQDIYLDAQEKGDPMESLLLAYDLTRDSVLYMGDDIPDLAAMSLCGVKTAPQDAAPEIKAIADYISPYKGGQGCVRDVIEQVLKLHGKW